MTRYEKLLPVRPAALLLACLAGTAQAADVSGVDARYRVATAGLELGQARLSLDPGEEGLAVGFAFENDAVLGLIEPSRTRMQALVASSGEEVSPRRFEGRYRKEDRSREVSFTYDGAGAIERFALVKRERVRVDEVPNGLPGAAIDPLAALMRARAWLGSAPEAGEEIAIPIFDGRKLHEARLRYLGPMDLQGVPAHRIAVRHSLTAELDEDTGKLERENGRERELDAVVSADGRYLPLQLSGSFDGLPLTAVLEKACAAPPGCAATP